MNKLNKILLVLLCMGLMECYHKEHELSIQEKKEKEKKTELINKVDEIIQRFHSLINKSNTLINKLYQKDDELVDNETINKVINELDESLSKRFDTNEELDEELFFKIRKLVLNQPYDIWCVVIQKLNEVNDEYTKSFFHIKQKPLHTKIGYRAGYFKTVLGSLFELIQEKKSSKIDFSLCKIKNELIEILNELIIISDNFPELQFEYSKEGTIKWKEYLEQLNMADQSTELEETINLNILNLHLVLVQERFRLQRFFAHLNDEIKILEEKPNELVSIQESN